MITVTLGSTKIIKGYTKEQKEAIISSLTYINPDYENAKKYSRWGDSVSLPPYKHYYRDSSQGLIVPRGYKVPFNHRIGRDDRFENDSVKYPKFRISLRGTQAEALEAYTDKLENKREYGVIVLPTGKGKSILGIALASLLQQRVLVIVQKDDLIHGWMQDCRLALGLRPMQVGLIKAKDFRLGRFITLTTIQTLSKLPKETLEELSQYFGMIICDEFHRSAAKSYELVNGFPAKYRIGLTATPYRNDGLEGVLYHYFGGIAYRYKENANDEDIMPVSIKIRIEKHLKWNPPPRYHYDGESGAFSKVPLKISDIRKIISHDEEFTIHLLEDICEEYNNEKSCIVFCHEKEQIRDLYHLLLECGVEEERMQTFMGSNIIKDMRGTAVKLDIPVYPATLVKKRAESKEVLITLATFAIATEGTNVKSWERGFLASTVANKKDLIQCIGRLRRRKSGKKDVIIYDYRFPFVAGARSHGEARQVSYNEVGFNVIT